MLKTTPTPTATAGADGRLKKPPPFMIRADTVGLSRESATLVQALGTANPLQRVIVQAHSSSRLDRHLRHRVGVFCSASIGYANGPTDDLVLSTVPATDRLRFEGVSGAQIAAAAAAMYGGKELVAPHLSELGDEGTFVLEGLPRRQTSAVP